MDTASMAAVILFRDFPSIFLYLPLYFSFFGKAICIDSDIKTGRKHKNHSALFRILLSPFNRKNKTVANRFFNCPHKSYRNAARLLEKTE